MKNENKHPMKLAEFWPYKAVFLADQISKFTRSLARETANLNLSQWRVLAAIAETSGTSAADVTAVTPMDKTIVSRAVQSLITLELIETSPDSHDKRRISLHATQKGYDLYNKIVDKLRAALTPNVSQDADAELLLNLLNDFIKRMDHITPSESLKRDH